MQLKIAHVSEVPHWKKTKLFLGLYRGAPPCIFELLGAKALSHARLRRGVQILGPKTIQAWTRVHMHDVRVANAAPDLAPYTRTVLLRPGLNLNN
jgi:hypothetical protein